MKIIQSRNSDDQNFLISRDAVESKLWRHTVGRVSCAVRIPFYAATVAAMVGKIVFKSAVSIAQLPLSAIKCAGIACYNLGLLATSEKNEKPDYMEFTGFRIHPDWDFSGVTRDGIQTLGLLQRVTNAAWHMIVAPPKEYLDFDQALRFCKKSIVTGSHHKLQMGGVEGKTTALWKQTIDPIPNYLRTISPQFRDEWHIKQKICG